MNIKTYTTAVVIVPPTELWSSIQEIRKERDRHFHRWMPHINLLYPFRPKHEFNPIEPLVKNVINKIEPFEVKFSNFKWFRHRKNNFTIWLEPEPVSLIKILQTKLLSLFPDCNDLNNHEGGFTPHLSVGQVSGKQNLKKVLHDLNRVWKPLEFNLNEIYFISRENQKNSKFAFEKTIELKKS